MFHVDFASKGERFDDSCSFLERPNADYVQTDQIMFDRLREVKFNPVGVGGGSALGPTGFTRWLCGLKPFRASLENNIAKGTFENQQNLVEAAPPIDNVI